LEPICKIHLLDLYTSFEHTQILTQLGRRFTHRLSIEWEVCTPPHFNLQYTQIANSDSQIASIRALIRCQSLIETQQFFLPQALIDIIGDTLKLELFHLPFGILFTFHSQYTNLSSSYPLAEVSFTHKIHRY
jgi:hypothetical protein